MNKIVNQHTHFPSHYVYDASEQYVGRIEKDQYGVWWLVNKKANRTHMWSYSEAREEAKLLKA